MHKSVAIKLVHNLTSPKWKDGGNGEVVSLDEEGFVDAEIRLGAFPGHQKVGSKLCCSGEIECHPLNLIKVNLSFSFLLISFWYYLL